MRRNIRTHLLRAAARPTSLFYRDLGAPRPRPLRAPRILDTACLARQVIESSLTHSLETARSSIMHVEFDRWMIGGSGSSASGPISTLSSGAMATPLYVLCQRVVYRSGVHTHRYAQLATTLPACSSLCTKKSQVKSSQVKSSQVKSSHLCTKKSWSAIGPATARGKLKASRAPSRVLTHPNVREAPALLPEGPVVGDVFLESCHPSKASKFGFGR